MRTNVSVDADGPWSIGVPMPISAAGETMGMWLASFQGQAAGVLPVATPKGPMLRFNGTGNVTLHGCLEPGAPESYLDDRWSTGEPSPYPSDPHPVWFEAAHGAGTVSLHFSARSASCGGFSTLQAAWTGPGLFNVTASEDFECS